MIFGNYVSPSEGGFVIQLDFSSLNHSASILSQKMIPAQRPQLLLLPIAPYVFGECGTCPFGQNTPCPLSYQSLR